jgi:hypothetical protein
MNGAKLIAQTDYRVPQEPADRSNLNRVFEDFSLDKIGLGFWGAKEKQLARELLGNEPELNRDALPDALSNYFCELENHHLAHHRQLIEKELNRLGGVYIGPLELAAQGVLNYRQNLLLPPMPEWLTVEFLRREHPVRRGLIGSHLLLAYDPESLRWVNIDMGKDRDCLFPGSVRSNGCPLKYKEMLRLTGPAQVGKIGLAPHLDHRPVVRALKRYIATSEIQDSNKFPFKPGHGGFTGELGTTSCHDTAVAIWRIGDKSDLFAFEPQSRDQRREQLGLITGWQSRQ